MAAAPAISVIPQLWGWMSRCVRTWKSPAESINQSKITAHWTGPPAFPSPCPSRASGGCCCDPDMGPWEINVPRDGDKCLLCGERTWQIFCRPITLQQTVLWAPEVCSRRWNGVSRKFLSSHLTQLSTLYYGGKTTWIKTTWKVEVLVVTIELWLWSGYCTGIQSQSSICPFKLCEVGS